MCKGLWKKVIGYKNSNRVWLPIEYYSALSLSIVTLLNFAISTGERRINRMNSVELGEKEKEKEFHFRIASFCQWLMNSLNKSGHISNRFRWWCRYNASKHHGNRHKIQQIAKHSYIFPCNWRHGQLKFDSTEN